MKRVSKKQKRVRAKDGKKQTSQKKASADAKAKLRAKALHLLLGEEHEADRKAAEKLRKFPHVPRKKQAPFPMAADLGIVGHFHDGRFEMQDKEAFIAEFVRNPDRAWYWYSDNRGNRSLRRRNSGMLETNAALSTGLSRVLADLVRLGQLAYVREVSLKAGESGMQVLCARTGYLPGYLALHPDSEGTLSTHLGMWTVDPEKHELVGRSAGGKRGRRGLRNLADSFISLQRHNRAIALPKNLMILPDKNRDERDPDDWAVCEEMDRVVREELSKLPNGPELLARADQYQREAAEDWLKRRRSTKSGVDQAYADLTEAEKRVRLLKRRLKKERQVTEQARHVMELLLKQPLVVKFLRSLKNVWSEIERLLKQLGLKGANSGAGGSPMLVMPQAPKAVDQASTKDAGPKVAVDAAASTDSGIKSDQGGSSVEKIRAARRQERNQSKPGKQPEMEI